MTEAEVNALPHGLYLLRWEGDERRSVAAVGSNAPGRRWYAATNWISGPSFDWGKVAEAVLLIDQDGANRLQAELAAERGRAGTAEGVLVDLLQESHAYAAGKREERAALVYWLRRHSEERRREELESSPYDWRHVAEIPANTLLSAAAEVEDGCHEPPPPGAILARLNEALEALRPFARAPTLPQMAGSDILAVTVTADDLRRAAEVLRRADRD